MEGVVCELADETGPMRSGMRHIDERLRSELVEDNVGPRAKHPCGARCLVPSAVASRESLQKEGRLSGVGCVERGVG